MVAAVTTGNLMVIGDLMVYFEIELPAGIAADYDLASVGIARSGTKNVRAGVEVQYLLPDRTDAAGWDLIVGKLAPNAGTPSGSASRGIVDAGICGIRMRGVSQGGRAWR